MVNDDMGSWVLIGVYVVRMLCMVHGCLCSHSMYVEDLSFKCKQMIPSGILKRDERDRCLYMCVLLGTETYVRDKGWIYGPMFGAIVMQWTHANKFL